MKDRIVRGARRLVSLVDWLIPLTIAFVVTILGFQERVPVSIVQTVTLGVLSLICLGSIKDRIKWYNVEGMIKKIGSRVVAIAEGNRILSDREAIGIERVFGGVVDHDWLPEIKRAKAVAIVKIKAAFTNSPEYFAALENVLDRGGSVTIVVSDPRAPATVMRYFDEPTGLTSAKAVKRSVKNPWVNGLEELSADIRRLWLWVEGLKAEGRSLRRLQVKVSANYPTHAFLKFDNRMFVYHYPYMSRGFHAPCMLFTGENTPVYQYLVECMEAVVDAADSLPESAEDIWQRCRNGEFSDHALEKVRISIEPSSKPPPQ